MRRAGTTASIATFAGLLAVLGVSTVVLAEEGEKQLYEAAKKEGQLTWSTAHYDQQLSNQIENAFTAKYPGIKVNVIKATAQVSFQRLLQDLKAGQVQSDVYSTTDVSQFVHLKEKGDLVKFTPENAAKVVKSLQGIDPDGFYHVTWTGLVAITYNKDKVSPADVPKNWPDLADPKWTGKVAVGEPKHNGVGGGWDGGHAPQNR